MQEISLLFKIYIAFHYEKNKTSTKQGHNILLREQKTVVAINILKVENPFFFKIMLIDAYPYHVVHIKK